MIWLRVFRVIGICLSLSLLPAAAQAAERKVYFFGNSLIHHLSDSDETAVPHWLAKMAAAAGHGFAADGQWGFLRDFAGSAPPKAEWSFRAVRSGWNRDRQAFSAAGWDAIVINPANFIQADPPDAPYGWDNPEGQSPLGAMLAVIDAHGVAPVYVYEGWAEMTAGFPPGRRAFRRYNAYNTGEYHAWYEDLVAQLRAARPGQEIRLIPVAKVLSELFTEGPLAGIDPRLLYVDADPHGTSTLYLLAAMVTYTALYGEPAPVALDLPESIAPEVQRAYPLLAAAIATRLKTFRAAQAPAQSGTGGQRMAAADPAPNAPGETAGLADPALAMGLNGISDWSTQQPFVDIMKTARPWLGHEGENWGAWNAARLMGAGYLDDNGWVTALPPGVDRVESFVLTDQNEAARAMTGRYRVSWQGEGSLKIGGRAQQVRYDGNEAWFRYNPGEGEVALTITETDPGGTGDHIRSIEIVREDQIALHELGVTFNPQWVERIADLRVLRFMDWMLTNGSPVKAWQDRPRRTDFSWAWRGVPAEVMIELANLVGADPWVCMPHAADDGYVQAFAELVRDRLDPRLKVYVEYSNELWNFIFPQARWAADQAEARWGPEAGEAPWMQFAGTRAAEVMRIWSAVFGAAAPDRLVRVVAVHTGWMGLEEPLLQAPLWQAEQGEGALVPAASFDAYAVSGYFGFELGDDEEGRLGDLRRWMAESRAAAEEEARARGLKWRAFRAAVEPVRFDGALPEAAAAVRQGSLTELTEVLWPYHAAVAETYGFRLIMYEGGSHAVGHAGAISDDELTAFFSRFSYTPEMAALYRDALEGWHAAGGVLFNAFVDVARSSQHGNWGALRHLEDDNPRWQALMAANRAGADGWEDRMPHTFAHGVLRSGGAGADELAGTAEEDILLGGDGDDVFESRGGGDFIDGGAGEDLVRLRGARTDYGFAVEAGRLLALSDGATVRLRQVELLEFDAEPGRKYRLETPQ
ncbi:calcium-binding protein [Marimonas arenosa]|uniref:Calcium-binding protein n=1 Tax=Marimonas arenosa TaxID=1795305 RepID=A0AAE3WA32_9RHOB|nr:calcium-binding protein [Marimonas arenosa]MDQ2089356.1 calcium-binding protein [Marimonas arenosa]